MKTTKLNHIRSLGFEIEGWFSWQLANDMRGWGDGDGADWTYDRSVEVPPESVTNRAGDRVWLTRYTEFRSDVFKELKEFLAALGSFKNGVNYWPTSSSGLHVHIGGVDRGALFRLKVQNELIALVKKIDPVCYARRFRNMYFFRKFRSSAEMRARRDDKYKFYNQHPLGTVELRFLTPCQHKIEVVSQVLGYVDSVIAQPVYGVRRVSVPVGTMDALTVIRIIY